MRNIVDTLVAWGPAGVFLLAILDSAGIPLPGGVDALLIVVAVVQPESAWLSAAAGIVGSLIGSWILFSLAHKGGDVYLARHTLSPHGKKLREWFQHYGLITVFIPALLPIPLPLKVPVLCAGALGVPLGHFLLTMAGARAARYLALAWLGIQLGDDAGRWLRDYAWHIIAFALALFVILFGLVWWKDRARERARTA